MSSIIYVIDGYLSSQDKVDVTIELISQLKRLDPKRKVMLVNKFNNSWGIETYVDYYREYLDGFLVGYPPSDITESQFYDKPYVYFDIDGGTLENWMPYVGVSDHVANVYNGFIYAANEAKNLGYEKVFRVEYDMLFDDDEFYEIKNDIDRLENMNYLIYGKRQEGKWASENHSLIDVHFCGYSVDIIENFYFVKNDDEYWSLCKKIGYAGKWAEYIMSMVFKYKMLENKNGIIYEGNVRKKFIKSKFDRISSSGQWSDKWKDIPKFAILDVNNGHQTDDTKIVIFYLNLDYPIAEVEVVGDCGYHRHIILNYGSWSYDIVERKNNMTFMSKVTHGELVDVYINKITNDSFDKLNTRFIKR